MYESEKLNLIMQQYKIYTEQKENFINRNFGVNRFYMVVLILLLLLIHLYKSMIFVYALSLPLVLSVIGMCICILWWINIDSYNILIKIKFGNVIEELEKQLPVQPFQMEHDAIDEYRKDKKRFLFSDIQKAFAIIMLIVFFISMMDELIPLIIKQFIL